MAIQQRDLQFPAPQRTVLIVEDEQHILDLLQNILEDAGYAVLIARDGLSALPIVYEQRPDLVLTDLMMPRMDGEALCERLRGDPSTAQLPIVGMSAGVESAAGARFTGFLKKPFDLDDVLRCVHQTLRAS